MSINTWIVVAGDPAVGNLIDTARSLGGQVCAAVVGSRVVADTVAAGGVDKVVWFGEPGKAPVEAFATAAADVIEATPGVVLGASRGLGLADGHHEPGPGTAHAGIQASHMPCTAMRREHGPAGRV